MNNISHITLKSSNIKKSHDFYCKFFDCDLEWDDDKTFGLLNAGFPVWIFCRLIKLDSPPKRAAARAGR